jgi:hypothetical protein
MRLCFRFFQPWTCVEKVQKNAHGIQVLKSQKLMVVLTSDFRWKEMRNDKCANNIMLHFKT